MLSLNSPPVALVPDGVCFYPDSDDPLTWYYLPLVPRVSLDAEGAPNLRLTKYVSDTQGFAILNLDVDLGLDEKLRNRYAAELKDELALTDQPRLVPMQAVEGRVDIVLLGRQSGKDGSGDLVSTINYPASPSLYGDNRAVFSVMLTPSGSQIVEASLGQGGMPDMSAIAVIYSLSFDALRPAYRVKAKARWDKVHTYLKNQLKNDGIFTGLDISKVVDTMKDNRIIDIQVDDMLTGDAAESAVKAMLTQVRTMVFDTFFKPAVQPKDDKNTSFLDGLGNLMEQGVRIGRTAGFGMLGQFTWVKEDRTEILTQTLDIDMHERSIVRMKLNPQAHLGEIFQRLGSPALVRSVSGNDPFFQKRNLTVDLNLPFTGPDNINSVVVDLQYGDKANGQSQSLLFSAADPSPKKVSWTSVPDADGRLSREVTARFTVNFQSVTGWPAVVTSPEQVITGDFWTAAPRTIYQLRTIRFMISPDFRWDQYPVVTLYARYKDDANGIDLVQSWPLMKPKGGDPTSATWSFLQRDAARNAFEYRLVCQAIGSPPLDMGWNSGDQPFVIIDPPKKDIDVYPPSPWPSNYDQITVQIASGDPTHPTGDRTGLIQFTSGATTKQTARLLTPDRSVQTFGYQVTYHANGMPVVAPRSMSDGSTIAIPPEPVGQTFILVRVDPAVFSDQVQATKVEVRLSHGESGMETSMVFTSASDAESFPYTYRKDPTVKGKAIFTFPDQPKIAAKLGPAKPGTDLLVAAPANL